jgi:hypothetical protein
MHDVRELMKKEKLRMMMTRQVMFSDEVTAYILEISAKKRNCSRKEYQEHCAWDAVRGAAEKCLIFGTLFFRTVGVADMLLPAP